MILKSLEAIAVSTVSLALTVPAASARAVNLYGPADPSASVHSAHHHAVITDHRLTAIVSKSGHWQALNDHTEGVGIDHHSIAKKFRHFVPDYISVGKRGMTDKGVIETTGISVIPVSTATRKKR